MVITLRVVGQDWCRDSHATPLCPLVLKIAVRYSSNEFGLPKVMVAADMGGAAMHCI